MWTQLDLVFKKFLNRRVTHSVKTYYEEFGDKAFDINAGDVKVDTIPANNPTQGITDGVVQELTLSVLTEDNSVPDQQAWYAGTPALRLRDWIPDRYGPAYLIKLYDGNDQQIFPTDASDWIFDYVTGVLLFAGDTSAFAKPFKVTGYRYIGNFLSSGAGGGGSKHRILFNGTALPDRANLDFTGGVNVTDDATLDKTVIDISAGAYTPTTPGDWGFADAVPTNATEGLDDLAEALTALLPAKASVLGTMTISGAGTFTGKLPSGLPTRWYGDVTAGTTVSNVIYQDNFNLSFNDFRSGRANTPATYGQASYSKDGTLVSTYDMTGGNGSQGKLTISGITPFNNFWSSADAVIAETGLADEGLSEYILVHTEAGATPEFDVYYDNNAVLPTFSANNTLAVNSKVDKWLSGVSYFGIGSVFDISYTVQNAFNKVYSDTGVTRVELVGLVTQNIDPTVTPAFNDDFVVAQTITLNDANKSSLNPICTVTVTKPNNNAAAQSQFDVTAGLGVGISTYGTVSTTTTDQFHDEAQRLYHGTTNTFDSTAALPTDEAMVVPGALTYGTGTGDKRYERRFTKATANSGTIIFTGITFNDISPQGTGDLNVLLLLETENIYFDLGRPFGDDNGDGSGSSIANARGARVSGTGDTVNFSFGTFSTANNSQRYRMIVVLRSASAAQMTAITTS